MAETHVVVVGSGAAGLAAALGAAQSGAKVTLLERAGTVGGTSAMSGGIAWIPANPYMASLGLTDSTEDALQYLKELCIGDANWPVVQAFVEDAARVAGVIEKVCPITWSALPDTPDYYAERPGATKAGRAIWAEPFSVAPDVAGRVQRSFELGFAAAFGMPTTDDGDDQFLFMGRAMIGGLLLGADELGVEVRTGIRARRLIIEGGVVRGVETDQGTFPGSVVIASGGFQFDRDLTRAFLRGPMLAPVGAPTCDGDGLRMALQAQAMLGNMGEGHWNTSMHVPGEEFEGAPYYRMLLYERAAPHSVIVNGKGVRFVNEAQNYGDVGRVLQNFYSPDYAFSNTPAWLLFDATYRDRYAVGPVRPGEPDPEWLIRADDVTALAQRIDVDAGTLADTLARFNAAAEKGQDPDFGRGSYKYDNYMGDSSAPHPNLGAVATPPFYAVQLVPGCASTKGGPVTDEWSRVLGREGPVIEGLYAAGVAAASPFGMATWASGNSLGPALVYGMRAGKPRPETDVQLENLIALPADPERVWPFLLDVERVVPCVPGANLTEVVDENTWNGRVNVSMGPLTLSYAGQVQMVERDDEARRVKLHAEGTETRGKGQARASVTFALEPAADGGTSLRAVTDLELTGAAAQYGQGLISALAQQLSKEFAGAVAMTLASIDAAPPGEAAPTPGSEAKPIAGFRLLARTLLATVGNATRRAAAYVRGGRKRPGVSPRRR